MSKNLLDYFGKRSASADANVAALEPASKASNPSASASIPSVEREAPGAPSAAISNPGPQKIERTDVDQLVPWPVGKPVPFSYLTSVYHSISEEAGRLRTTDLLAECFKDICQRAPEDLLAAVYLTTGTIAPPHAGVELGIGPSMIQKAVQEAFGKDAVALKKLIDQHGDLGDAAQACRGGQTMLFKPQRLTVRHVYEQFMKIATDQGKNSQTTKRDRMKALLVACRHDDFEPLFLVRLLECNLRIGAAEQTILDALAIAFQVDKEMLKQKFADCPSFDILVPALLHGSLGEVKLTPGIPVRPMLAKPSNIGEVKAKYEGKEAGFKFTAEYKYDGERAQLHRKGNGDIFIFSRNAENHTPKYPEIVEVAREFLPQTSYILDCEVVAVQGSKILPFQTLTTRSRKNVDGAAPAKVSVCLFVFDVLFFSGSPTLSLSLQQRREVIRSNFPVVPGSFDYATFLDVDVQDMEVDLMAFLKASLVANCEGLMVKDLLDPYDPGKRTGSWLKIKKDYQEGMTDSVDLVPIGAYFGKGKRTGTYGAFLLACYNTDNEEFEAICKIGTGFSEEDLAKFHEELSKYVLTNPPHYYSYPDRPDLLPDVWFDSKVVWEVLAADLSISPVYTAALGAVDPEKGIGLRFPRFLRSRTDKDPRDCTSAQQIVDMYHNQASVK